MKYLTIDKFWGGLADGSRLGVEGAFRFGQGLDYKSNIDSITADLALAKNSSTNVTGLVKYIVYDPTGNKLYACDDGGKIYSSASSWTALQTTSNCTGQGLEIYSDYLYYRQNAQIGRYGALSGSPSFTDNWQTSNVQTATGWASMKTFMNLLCACNGRYLATWDGSTFTYNKLTFPPGFYARDLDVRGEYLAIAVNDSADITKAKKILDWKPHVTLTDGLSSMISYLKNQ